jgi:Tol biopolymer transport system component
VLGKLLITAMLVATIIGPVVADWNESHVFNPERPPHARFDGEKNAGKIVFDLFDGKGRSGVFQADPNGNDIEKLLDPSPVVTAHRLSPDGRMLLYRRPVRGRDGKFEGRLFLSVLTIKDKLTIDLEENTQGHCWTPDSEHVFFARASKPRTTEVLWVKPNTSERKILFQIPHEAWVEDCSPDGQRLLLTFVGDAFVALPPVRQKETDVYVVGRDGKDLTNLTRSQGLNLRPRFSPDGRRILFVSLRSGTSQVHVMDADGENVKQLTTFPAEGGRCSGAIYGCTWSPDGKRIAYSWTEFPHENVARLKPPAIWIAKANGSNAVPLAVGERASTPDWR